jgi:excisionase family DNA binding protein
MWHILISASFFQREDWFLVRPYLRLGITCPQAGAGRAVASSLCDRRTHSDIIAAVLVRANSITMIAACASRSPSPMPRSSKITPPQEPPLAVSPASAARLLSMAGSKVYAAMRAGELQSYVDGRSRRIPMTEITAYMARRIADSAGGWVQITPKPPRSPREKPRAAAAP